MTDHRCPAVAFRLGFLMALTPPGSPGAEIGPYGQQALEALAEAIEAGDREALRYRICRKFPACSGS